MTIFHGKNRSAHIRSMLILGSSTLRGLILLQELEVKNNHVDLFDDKTTVAHWGHSTPFSLVVTQLKFSCYTSFLVTQLKFIVSQLKFPSSSYNSTEVFLKTPKKNEFTWEIIGFFCGF